LLATPGVPQLPDYCDAAHRAEKLDPVTTWGNTSESFYLVRKGPVETPGWEVSGTPGPAMGVVVTIQAEPMDAFDCRYIEREIVGALSMMAGVRATYEEGRLLIHQGAGVELDPARVGEVLFASVRREFPRLSDIRVEIVFDPDRIASMAPGVRAEKQAREAAIRDATEESATEFYGCVGCSPFAPDHVCILTPERPPQCGRPYEMIKTGALYGFDDMSNIHHSKLHRDLNSFRVVEKGECLDSQRGEWSGINAHAAALTEGRTTRIRLHSLDDCPHTGCGCFRLIMFQTQQPRPGIGVMDAGYEGPCPDGRIWRDLHYALGGKQAPGMAGAPPAYLFSRKFLRAHGGWASVVWVSPKVAELMGDGLAEEIVVGPTPGSRG
jgi:acetyl-CoA decarbonylase/synthase complex subunit beta